MKLDSLRHGLEQIRSYIARSRVLPSPKEALSAHARREFDRAGILTPSKKVFDAAVAAALDEMRPHLRGALYTPTKPTGKYHVGGRGLYLPGHERNSDADERHHAQAVHAARVRWEKEERLVKHGERPVSVTAVLHRPPGAEHLVGYPHDAFAAYGRHITLIDHPEVKWCPGDTHNLKTWERLESMTKDHAVVMAATEGIEEDPLRNGVPGGSEYPEGLILGGLTFHGKEARYHADKLKPQLWHPSGMTYGAWRVLHQIKAQDERRP